MRAAGEILKQPGSVPVEYWEGFIPETEAADFLCQSVRTIQKWRVTGAGPQFYKFGRSVRYRRRELFDWVEERRRAHTSE
ncbi:helix-turn-helix domain-containing protein [Ostreiculturibacter nitratireducens]|uniref:helix-turn-helix transcriptional regulator n=1 Tax=Ostreiculturibacter nitratireducens TaxID=3075226 RepID=UPI0031B62C6E